jgi:hypothetical protein
MAAPIDPVSATQGSGIVAPIATFNVDGTPSSAPLSPADVKASTMGQLAATPEGLAFQKLLYDAVEMQAYNHMKRDAEKLKEAQKQRRAEAQGG